MTRQIEIRCTRENVREALSDLFPDPSAEQDAAIDAVVEYIDKPYLIVWEKAVSLLGVKVTIVPDADPEPLPHMHDEYDDKPCLACVQEKKTLSTSQASIPNTPEEEAAWREKERQATVAGQEEHAANRPRYAPGGYYARTVDERLPTEQEMRPVLAAINAQIPEGTRILAINGNAGDKTFWAEREAVNTARAGIVEGAKHIATVHDAEYYTVDNANAGEVGTFTDGPEERYSVGGRIDAQGDLALIDRFKPPMSQCIGWAKSEHAELIVDALNAWEASQ